jgi:hypothetical protein
MDHSEVDLLVRGGDLKALMARAETELLEEPSSTERESVGISASISALVIMMACLGWGTALMLCCIGACVATLSV